MTRYRYTIVDAQGAEIDAGEVRADGADSAAHKVADAYVWTRRRAIARGVIVADAHTIAVEHA
jgi:hypothetical protein